MPDRQAGTPSPEESSDEPTTVEEAWAAMARTVPTENRAARTPAELARRAVAAGFPREPVRRLTRAFQEVAYGGRPRTGERRNRALEALERLRQRGDDE